MQTLEPKTKPNFKRPANHVTTISVPLDVDRWIRDFALKTGRTYRGVIIMALQSYRDTR